MTVINLGLSLREWPAFFESVWDGLLMKRFLRLAWSVGEYNRRASSTSRVPVLEEGSGFGSGLRSLVGCGWGLWLGRDRLLGQKANFWWYCQG